MKSRYSPCPKCRAKGNDTSGDNLVHFQDGGAHCYACGYHEFGNKIPQQLKKEIPNVPKNLLASDFTREVPTTALKWLLQYGLPWSYWKDQIGFSPAESRLIFQVGKPMQFSIGRYVGNAVPAPRKWYVWGDPHRHCEVVGSGKTVVLVEDLISAHKIAASCPDVESIPLFGVELHKPHMYYLLNENKPVVFWLDKDQQGSIMRKAMRLQALTGRAVSVVSTERDPKELTREELNENLRHVGSST